MTNIHDLATALVEVRELKTTLAADLKHVEDREKALHRDIQRLMEDSGAEMISACGLKFARTEKAVVTVDPEHWLEVFGWIAANDRWELVRKQLNSTSTCELLATGQEIPFVRKQDIPELKITKA